jgi:hypothetical protein
VSDGTRMDPKDSTSLPIRHPSHQEIKLSSSSIYPPASRPQDPPSKSSNRDFDRIADRNEEASASAVPASSNGNSAGNAIQARDTIQNTTLHGVVVNVKICADNILNPSALTSPDNHPANNDGSPAIGSTPTAVNIDSSTKIVDYSEGVHSLASSVFNPATASISRSIESLYSQTIAEHVHTGMTTTSQEMPNSTGSIESTSPPSDDALPTFKSNDATSMTANILEESPIGESDWCIVSPVSSRTSDESPARKSRIMMAS